MFRYGWRRKSWEPDGRVARRPACCGGAVTAAPSRAVRPRGIDRYRIGANSWSKPTARLAPFETPLRGRAPRSYSRGELGILSARLGNGGQLFKQLFKPLSGGCMRRG